MNTRQKSVLTFSSKLTIKTAEKHQGGSEVLLLILIIFETSF